MLPQRVEAGKPGGGAAGGGRKLVIKPLKSAPKLPQDFEQNTWGKLVAAVHAVHNKQAVAHSLEELYRAVQDMCLNGMASTVYDRLQTECERHIEGRLNALLGQTPDTLAFLNLVHGTWDDHCEQMHTLRSIFLYLDRTYVMQARPPAAAAPAKLMPGRTGGWASPPFRAGGVCAPLLAHSPPPHSSCAPTPLGRRRSRRSRCGRWGCRSSTGTCSSAQR